LESDAESTYSIFIITLQCWQFNRDNRPNFSEIVTQLSLDIKQLQDTPQSNASNTMSNPVELGTTKKTVEKTRSYVSSKMIPIETKKAEQTWSYTGLSVALFLLVGLLSIGFQSIVPYYCTTIQHPFHFGHGVSNGGEFLMPKFISGEQ